MPEFALLVTALLFGGSILYSVGFAAFVFAALPSEAAGPLIRRAFPHFYLFVLATSALAAATLLPFDPASSAILVVISITTVFSRQVLMPAINAATDAGARGRFKTLHTISVLVTLLHIVGAAIVIIRLAHLS